MDLARQSVMVKSVAKNMRSKERKEAKIEKARDNLYKVLRKVGKPLDEIKRRDLTKREYKIVLDYYEVVRGYSPRFMIELEESLN